MMNAIDKKVAKQLNDLVKALSDEIDRRVPSYEQEGMRYSLSQIVARVEALTNRVVVYDEPREHKKDK